MVAATGRGAVRVDLHAGPIGFGGCEGLGPAGWIGDRQIRFAKAGPSVGHNRPQAGVTGAAALTTGIRCTGTASPGRAEVLARMVRILSQMPLPRRDGVR